MNAPVKEAETTKVADAPEVAEAPIPENVDSPVTLSVEEQDALLVTAAEEAERPKVDAPGNKDEARAWSQAAPQADIYAD